MLLAHFLTWHTYATWLHGDERGSVDLEHNAHNTPVLAPDVARHEVMLRASAQAPFELSAPARDIVERAIRDHSAIREWHIEALNVRSNHVHVIVAGPSGYTPEQVMQQFKS